VHFNASHSGKLAIYAVTSACPVGIDIERVRDISDCHVIGLRHFAPLEASLLLAAPPDRRREEFLVCWTRTEAFLKATGEGLGRERRAAPSSDWRIHTLWPAAGYVAAVAYTHDAAQLSLWTVTEEALCRSQS
jgi:4'-phosphopantetheinyl transferase